MKQLAKWVSVVLHPMVMLLATSLVTVSFATQSFQAGLWWTLYAGIFVVLLGLFVAWGVKRRMFSNFDVSQQSQRKPLYLAAVILASVYVLGLMVLQAPSVLFAIAATLLCLVVGLSIANRWIKASGHVACVTVLATALVLMCGTVALPALLLIPLMSWSRISLSRHTLPETITGAIVGLASVLLIVILA